MKAYLLILICSILIIFISCRKNPPVISKKEYKSLLYKAISNREFLPLLESSTVTKFDVIMKNTKLSDSIRVGKNVFFINQPKLKFDTTQIINIKVDSISEIKKDMEIVYGNVPQYGSQIYGKFSLQYKNEKWEVNYITSGIWDYR